MGITEAAFKNTRLAIFFALAILVGGIALYIGYPSQEEPDVPVNEAVVTAYFPGLSPARMEDLVARPIETKMRELGEVEHVVTTVRPGFVLIHVKLYQSIPVADYPMVWQRLRAKMREVEPSLPQGAQGPIVDDEFGRVAVASIAITAPGFTIGEMNDPIRRMRDRLYALPGVERVTIHGLQEERVFLEVSSARLASVGLAPETLLANLQRQNVVLPGGEIEAGGLLTSIDPSGNYRSLDAIRRTPVTLPSGGIAYLGDLVTIRRGPQDPPQVAAFYKGDPAVVLAVSMAPGRNVESFGAALKERVGELGNGLPVGFQVHFVTFQPEVVKEATSKVQHTLYETLAIVMGVVVLFLGLRTGVIVGAIVPLTMLASLALMHALGIPLHNVSLATIIIALGLLVDNGIVVAEDIVRRLAAGEDRKRACIEAGRTLAVPLLASSLTIILAFMPLLLARSNTAEYAKSMSYVIAITLLSSWVLSLTITPLLCFRFARVRPGESHGDGDAEYEASRFYRWYRNLLEGVLRHRVAFAGAMVAALALAVFELGRVPFELSPNSTRPQFQIPIELPAGASTRRTVEVLGELSAWLNDRKQNPEVVDHVAYAGEGGPRFILTLNPPDPAPHRGYVVINLDEAEHLAPVIERTRTWIIANLPEARAEPKAFSLGATEAGLVVYRVIGPELDTLRIVAERIAAAMERLPGATNVKSDAENGIARILIDVDQERARRAGVTTEDVARSLEQAYSGAQVSVFREGDRSIPIVLRSSADERLSLERLWSVNVFPQGAVRPAAVPLSAVATIDGASQPGVIQRYDLERAVSVSGLARGLTASQVVERLAPELSKIELPSGYRIELGGEIEESDRANAAILGPLPLCFLAMVVLFVWQFNSFRKVLIVVATIPFCIIGVAVALALSGAPLSFMGTLGLLSLAGIIVNNAILLLERIDAELEEGKEPHEALVMASVKRLRPIVMTKLVCILGLIPLMLFGGPLWYPMAVVIVGGLALGSLVTLGLIPVLYSWLFRVSPRPPAAPQEAAA